MVFQIVDETTHSNKRYRYARRNVCFKLDNIPEDCIDPEAWLKNGIRGIVEHIVQDVDADDKVGFSFGSSCFNAGEAYLSFRKASTISFEDIWNLVGKLYQSNSHGFHTDTFHMTMTQLKPYRGAGRVTNYNNFQDECHSRRGIVCINNTDNLCLARAIVVGMAYADNSEFTEQIRRNRGKIQDIETLKLLQESSVQIPETGAGVEELKKFQAYLSDYKITVYVYGTKGRTVLFEGSEATKKINLLHHNNHYNVITNLKSAFVCRYYCEPCHAPYDHKNAHRCAASCPCCQQIPPCEKTNQEITCDDCHRKFRSIECYNKHKAPNSNGKTTICLSVKRCPDCLKTIKANRQHTCGEIFCHTCNVHHQAGQYCFIKPDARQPPHDKLLFIFYDLEARQDEVGDNGEKIHIPNLCVFQQRCSYCMEEGNDKTTCARCGIRRQILKHDNVIQRFVEYLLGIRKQWKKVVIMAHNGKSYDHQFLLKHVLENTALKVELIMRGSSIIMLGLENLKLIDSINYFPMKLAKLPEAFDLGGELKKGYFPHFFNTLANKQYVGPLPAVEFYGVDSMKENDRITFLAWHKLHENDIFDLQKDLVDYCVSDVDILTKACLKFRKLFLDECNVCPFTEAVTIASACNLVYRRNFLKPNTIGLIPRGGYRNTDNQSKIATLWLIYEESQRGINITHSAKQQESVVDGAKVDGFCAETNQVFEFNGCYFHGCPKCFVVGRDDPVHEDPSDTLNNRMQRTTNKIERLRQRGYEVIVTWECEFRRMLQENKNLAKELQDNPLMTTVPLDPRDAFYGGRTGNCKSYYQCKPGEKIKYVDVCSLYPWACKYGKFTINHPTVIIGKDCSKLDLQKTDGLIKCKILPPQQLYHPVLPLKMNDKLMFVLCRTCGNTMNNENCQHSTEERALTGTWVMDEVRKALEMEYTMLEIYEVWQYKTEQYDSQSKVGGLFTKMMNKFIKMKQQASGWPGECVTDEQKYAYIEDFLNKEGIKMEFSEIVANPGLRSLAKLMLNSFWGKFGQRENQPKTSIIRQPAELDKLMVDPAIEVTRVRDVNDNTFAVSWGYKDEAADLLSTVNVCIAAYTTAHARLKLYSYLEALGDRVLYYDTDSVIYVSRPGEYDIPTGPSLGEMTNELESYGKGSYILAFVSGGPKNYSYLVFSPQNHTYYTVCKVKGLSLNYNVLKLVNFHSMREMVISSKPLKPLLITTMNIRRTKQHQVISKEETKIYRPNSEKRKFDESFDSVPYGYKKLCVGMEIDE